jgi:hypothetical protein
MRRDLMSALFEVCDFSRPAPQPVSASALPFSSSLSGRSLLASTRVLEFLVDSLGVALDEDMPRIVRSCLETMTQLDVLLRASPSPQPPPESTVTSSPPPAVRPLGARLTLDIPPNAQINDVGFTSDPPDNGSNVFDTARLLEQTYRVLHSCLQVLPLCSGGTLCRVFVEVADIVRLHPALTGCDPQSLPFRNQRLETAARDLYSVAPPPRPHPPAPLSNNAMTVSDIDGIAAVASSPVRWTCLLIYSLFPISPRSLPFMLCP